MYNGVDWMEVCRRGLLIDECYDVGKKWDRFVYGVKCIMVRFVHGIGD
jgi:hypothetical protein